MFTIAHRPLQLTTVIYYVFWLAITDCKHKGHNKALLLFCLALHSRMLQTQNINNSVRHNQIINSYFYINYFITRIYIVFHEMNKEEQNNNKEINIACLVSWCDVTVCHSDQRNDRLKHSLFWYTRVTAIYQWSR